MKGSDMSSFSNVLLKQKKLKSNNTILKLIPLIILFFSIILLSILNPYFFTYRNFHAILLQVSSLGLMSFGLTLALIVRGIDLSIPPVMALSAILGVKFMSSGGNPVLGLLIMVCAGIICGFINGYAISRLRMIPFLVTLSTQAIVYGTCLWITKAVGISGIHPKFIDIILIKIYGVSVPIYVVIIFTILLQILLTKSILGRWLYMTGINKKMAEVSGVPVKHVEFSVYVLSGLFAGITAVFLSARLGAASASMGESGGVLDIIGAAVIGGASIYGGVGTAIGAMFGALIITIISNAMNMLHVSYFNMLLVKGFVIIIFVALDSYSRKKQGKAI